jgi:hypothetical protein
LKQWFCFQIVRSVINHMIIILNVMIWNANNIICKEISHLNEIFNTYLIFLILLLILSRYDCVKVCLCENAIPIKKCKILYPWKFQVRQYTVCMCYDIYKSYMVYKKYSCTVNSWWNQFFYYLCTFWWKLLITCSKFLLIGQWTGIPVEIHNMDDFSCQG